MTRPKNGKYIPEDQKKGNQLPSTYTEEMAKRICFLTATNATSMKKLCKQYPEIPSHETICRWRIQFPEFGEMYLEAKKSQAMLYADETIDIADDDSRDLLENDKGTVANAAAVARAKLRIDTRKWYAATLAPRMFGDKTQTEITLRRHEDILNELE